MHQPEAMKLAIMDEMILASESKIAEYESAINSERLVLAALREKRRSMTSTPTKADQAADSNGSADDDEMGPEHLGDDTVETGGIPELILQCLKESSGPMRFSQLVRAVESRGAVTAAKKGLTAVVSSALGRRDDIFVRLARGLYDLKSRHENKENGVS